jgi:hypothetical protein
MKRIYLLFFLIGISGSLFAQTRSVDLQLTSQVRSWQGNNKVLLVGDAAPAPDTFRFIIKNLGPNDLTSADTIIFDTPYGSGFRGAIDATKGLKKDSTTVFQYVSKIGPGTLKSQSVSALPWCDSIWVSSMGKIVADPAIANNKSCNNVELTVWATSINDANVSSNTMAIYPNPASSQINVRFDFGSNATATLAVRDILGKVVYQQDLGKNLAGEKEFSINSSNFASGLYFIELSVNDSKKVAKVTVQ